MNKAQAMPAGFEKQDPVFYAGDELHRFKQQKVQQALERSEFDAFMFFKAEAVRYVTDFYVKGFRPFMEPEYVVLVVKGKPPVVGYISGSDDLRIRFKSDIEDARRLPPVTSWHTVIAGMIADYGLANARIGTDLMPFMVHEGLKAQFPALRIGNLGKVWAQLTAVKHPIEVQLIRNSVRVADMGADAAIAAIKPGVSEHSVVAEAVYVMRKQGSEFEPFIPLVASGYNTSMFERVATEKIMRAGEMVILDLGAVVKGYTADLGRTVICGGDPTPEQKAIYQATHLALHEAKKIIKPGVTCQQIDARAREVIRDAGWGDYLYTGNTGHQLGYGLHGDPLVDKNIDFEVVENMVMCLEPRIVLPDRPDIGGAHLEDVVLVTKDGHEQINTTPYDQRLLK
ncbi:M24 family metallopeptidase [Ramlibacter sp.]|uniref:M24 family metallopeptidase n=1 Tax=Ramlibacter sp. TaxID=1917967 RepID=UPI003D0D3CC2